MKKNHIKIKVCSIFFTIYLLSILISNPILAASGSAYIVYDSSINGGSGFYSKSQDHLKAMGYTISIFNKPLNTSVISYMKKATVFVCGLHGSPGTITCANDTAIVSSGLENGQFTSISSLPSNALSSMKIALIYSCEAGKPGPMGDIIAYMCKRGAKCAVGWRETLFAPEANEWNRLFFEKAKNDTVVESFRHADYWLNSIKGTAAHERMKNRNEQGSITHTIS